MTAPQWDLGAATKPIDSWWTVAAVDPLAVRLLPLLLRFRRTTPNAVTGLAFVVGLGSVASFATQRWVLGALLYELRFFLDCLDGKIARVRRLSSPRGAMFDRLADMFTIPSAYAAIGLALAGPHLPSRLALLPALGAVLVSGVEAVLEVARAKQPAPTGSAVVPAAGLVGWARRHRLTLRPWTVEAETLGLFLGPLFLRGDALGALELGLVGVYALFAVVDLIMIFRVVAEQPVDRCRFYLDERAAVEARRRGISKSELIRRGLDAVLPATTEELGSDPWRSLAGFGSDGISVESGEIDDLVYRA